MKGLIGAATVMGSLMYGAGHVWAGRANFYLHDQDLCHSLPDAAFLDMLTQNCRLSGPHFRPPAIVEVLQGLCYQPSQSTAVASYRGRLVEAVELQHCPGKRDHRPTMVCSGLREYS